MAIGMGVLTIGLVVVDVLQLGLDPVTDGLTVAAGSADATAIAGSEGAAGDAEVAAQGLVEADAEIAGDLDEIANGIDNVADSGDKGKFYMWHEFIQSLEPTVQRPIEMRFANGVGEEQIAAVEKETGVALPKDLRSLLSESNGVRDQYGWRIIWSVEEISQYNREMRTLSQYKNIYMSFTDMLFFADDGTGNRFAFPILQGKVKETRIFAWTSGDDSRIEVAFSLKSYLERLLSGKIKL